MSCMVANNVNCKLRKKIIYVLLYCFTKCKQVTLDYLIVEEEKFETLDLMLMPNLKRVVSPGVTD